MGLLMPTLSAKGWTQDTNEKLDFALAHFFEAEETQTYLYPGKIADVHSIIARNTHDMDSTVTDMSSTLEAYLKTIFDEAIVEGVNISKRANDPDDKTDIMMVIRVTDHDRVIESGKMATYSFNKFKTITTVSNYGNR